MKIKVKLFATIRLDIGFGEIDLEISEPTSIIEILRIISEKINFDLIEKLLDEGKMIPGVIILINGKNIYHMDNLETIVDKECVLSIFPAAAGG